MPSLLTAVLNLLESFRSKTQVQVYLKQWRIPRSGTWSTVREHITKGVRSRKTSLDELVELLEEVEEHGNQYVFLYDLDLRNAGPIRTRQGFKRALTREERRKALDQIIVIEKPPEEPTLTSARYTDNQAKLKWVQKKTFRRPLGETISGRIVTVRYEIVSVRAVDLALFNLEEKYAYICLHKVESGVRNYRDKLSNFLQRLTRFVPEDALKPVDLGSVLKKIGEPTFSEVRRRRHQQRDDYGNVFDVSSATETNDIFDGGFYKDGRAGYTGHLADLHANAYWKPIPGGLEREIHTILPYRQCVNCVVFMQRCLRDERDYVLSRIRAIAKS